MQDAVLIVNTQSRRGQALYSSAKQALEEAGIQIAASFPVRDGSRFAAVVQDAISEGHRFIIVGGGDGTVSSVASLFANKDVVLGLIPMGTANNFARGNGIPAELRGAVRVLAQGKVAQVDLGRIDETYFTNAVSVGITSRVHRGSPDQLKRHLGRVGYLLAAARQFSAFQKFRCRLVLDGRVVETEAYDLRIANGPFQGGMRAVGEASLRSGELVVRVTGGSSKWNFLHAWARVAARQGEPPASVETFRARLIEISAAPRQFASVDGEVLGETPVTVCVAPGALHLVVP